MADTKTKRIDLKPCPFCGHEAAMQTVTTAMEAKPRFRVVCPMCRISTDWDFWTREDAAEHWNRRASSVDAIPVAWLRRIADGMPESVERHGHWDAVKDYSEGDRVTYECSECGGAVASEYGFCPYCGARMEAEADG